MPPFTAARLLFCSLLTATSALAHEIPDERVDRTIQLTLEPGRLIVDYEVALSELTALLDLRRLDHENSESVLGPDARERYGRLVAPLHANAFLASVDDVEQTFTLVSVDYRTEDHLIYRFTFETDLPPAGHLRFRDANYLESNGTSRLGLRVHPGVHTVHSRAVSDAKSAQAKPRWTLSDGEELATRSIELDYATIATARPFARSHEAELVPSMTSTTSSPVAWSRGVVEKLLEAESRSAFLLAAGLALLLGVAHALQPGHGKFLVAATSIGQGGSPLRALSLASIVSVTHLASVVALAVFLWSTRAHRYESIDSALKLVAGSLLAIQGAYRVGRALSGPAACSSQAEPGRAAGGIAAVGAGLLPCWDALLLLVLAEAQGRFLLGLSLVAAFSLGLLLVQFAVALGAARMTGLATSKGANRVRFVGGIALLGLGLAMVIDF